MHRESGDPQPISDSIIRDLRTSEIYQLLVETQARTGQPWSEILAAVKEAAADIETQLAHTPPLSED